MSFADLQKTIDSAWDNREGLGLSTKGAVRDAVEAGRRALYVCYNRPLADHIALVAPPGVEVATYHQLCNRMLRAHGQTPSFGRPDAFARLEAAFQELDAGDDWRFDELIVDEGQDFREDWRDALLRLLRPGG